MAKESLVLVITPCSLIERWVTRHLGGIAHERSVARLATQLFNLTRGHHGLSAAHRQLLQKAALVHDVGRCREVQRHPQIGARMILDACLPLSGFERRALAFLTRHHRGTIPELGEDRILRQTDPHRDLRVLLALLRAADALDSRSLGSIDIGFSLRGDRLKVICHTDGQRHKLRKILSKRKKFRLLEDLLDVRVKVQVAEESPALAMVA
jgi:exopolyphosphatase/pppGpp-phosphohydrolase